MSSIHKPGPHEAVSKKPLRRLQTLWHFHAGPELDWTEEQPKTPHTPFKPGMHPYKPMTCKD